jgi:hypothetical protein
MRPELKRTGPPMLAALLTVSVTAMAQAEQPTDRTETEPPAMSEELELLKEEETVSIATRYEQPISHIVHSTFDGGGSHDFPDLCL